jgi:hypothetical protein
MHRWDYDLIWLVHNLETKCKNREEEEEKGGLMKANPSGYTTG